MGCAAAARQLQLWRTHPCAARPSLPHLRRMPVLVFATPCPGSQRCSSTRPAARPRCKRPCPDAAAQRRSTSCPFTLAGLASAHPSPNFSGALTQLAFAGMQRYVDWQNSLVCTLPIARLVSSPWSTELQRHRCHFSCGRGAPLSGVSHGNEQRPLRRDPRPPPDSALPNRSHPRGDQQKPCPLGGLLCTLTAFAES